MKEFIDKLIERLEEYEQERLKMYDWQGQSATSDAIVIIKDIADEYRTCYKSCTECEAYNKEKHYCPKWCDVIKNTISELAEEYKVSEMPTGWIPCSERLPELTEGTECFKQSKCCLVALKWWDGDITESVAWYNQSGVWNEDSKNCKVIAWMPLPPAWKGDCDGEA